MRTRRLTCVGAVTPSFMMTCSGFSTSCSAIRLTSAASLGVFTDPETTMLEFNERTWILEFGSNDFSDVRKRPKLCETLTRRLVRTRSSLSTAIRVVSTGSFAQDIDQPRRLDLNIGDLRIGDKDGLRRPAKPDQDTVTDFEVDRSGGFANNLICLNRGPQNDAAEQQRGEHGLFHEAKHFYFVPFISFPRRRRGRLLWRLSHAE